MSQGVEEYRLVQALSSANSVKNVFSTVAVGGDIKRCFVQLILMYPLSKLKLRHRLVKVLPTLPAGTVIEHSSIGAAAGTMSKLIQG